MINNSDKSNNKNNDILNNLKKRLKVNELKKKGGCPEIGTMKSNPYFTLEIINSPNINLKETNSIKQQKINKIISNDKLENAIYVQQKITKSVNKFKGLKEITNINNNLNIKNKIFEVLSKNKKKDIINNKQIIKQIGPFKNLKMYCKYPISFNNYKPKHINLNLKTYFKFPHKLILFEKSKLFSSIRKQFQISLDSVFNNFINFNKEFYILLKNEVILFSNKKVYVPNSMKMDLINNDIEFKNLIKDNSIKELNNYKDNLYNYLLNKELIINNPEYFILEDINIDLIFDHLLNNNTFINLPFIFSAFSFNNSIIYTPHIKKLGIIKDNSGINYGYKLSGYGLIEDIINELNNSCSFNCKNRIKTIEEICDCIDIFKNEIKFIFQ